MTKKQTEQTKKEEKKPVVEHKGRLVVRTGKEHGKITDLGMQALQEAKIIEEKTKKIEEEVTKVAKKVAKTPKPPRPRGKKYQQAKKLVDPQKLYPLKEAIKLVKQVSFSKFPGSVEVHLVVKEQGIKGEIEFPYPTGKEQKIRIADEALLKDLEKGKIDFTLLVASPKMMPKLAKYAKLLGPKGLMPNPKAGTIGENPEELAKKFQGKTHFKTEPKAPLIHLVIGKVNQPEEELEKNFLALVEAVGVKNIKKAAIAPTMGPGIKIKLE
ncbi:MAG: hypothetical protein ACPLKP_03830 [Microgenomates group bacterium]